MFYEITFTDADDNERDDAIHELSAMVNLVAWPFNEADTRLIVEVEDGEELEAWCDAEEAVDEYEIVRGRYRLSEDLQVIDSELGHWNAGNDYVFVMESE